MRQNITEPKEKNTIYHEVIAVRAVCDLCLKEYIIFSNTGLSRDGYYVSQVELLIDPDQCVNTRIERDICEPCWDLIEGPLKALLKIGDDEI